MLNDISKLPNIKKMHATIYIDESGELGENTIHNKNSPYYIMGFCYCKNPEAMGKSLKKILRKCQKKGLYPSNINELKFYPTFELAKKYSSEQIKDNWEDHYPQIRKKVIESINAHSDGIFVGIVDKNEQITDELKFHTIAFRLFKNILLNYVLPNIDHEDYPKIIFDNGVLNNSMKKMLDCYRSYYNNVQMPSDIIHSTASVKIPHIWASDFIAGSFHQKYQNKDSKYADRLDKKLIVKYFDKLIK